MTHKIDLETFKIIIDTVFDAKTPEALGSQVTRLITAGMEIKGCALFIVNPAREELEILATEGLSAGYRKKGPIIVDKSIRLAPNREPVIIENTLTSKKLQYQDKAIKEGIGAIVSLPVQSDGRLIGALRLYHFDTWAVSDEDLAYLQVLAKTLAMALKYFRLSAAVNATKEIMDEIHPVWLA